MANARPPIVVVVKLKDLMQQRMNLINFIRTECDVKNVLEKLKYALVTFYTITNAGH